MASNFRQLLEHFRVNDQPSVLEIESDKKIFFELQRYNLLRLNSEGRIIITQQGEKALSTGVEEYIRNLKLEKRRIKDACKLRRERNILTAAVILLSIGLILTISASTDTLLRIMSNLIF